MALFVWGRSILNRCLPEPAVLVLEILLPVITAGLALAVPVEIVPVREVATTVPFAAGSVCMTTPLILFATKVTTKPESMRQR